MAVNNNGEVVAFVREALRRRAEIIRALKVLMEDDLTRWNQGISALVQNSAEETIFEDRDYVQPLTGEDCYTIMNREWQLLQVLQQANWMDVINKACIRSLEVSLGM